MDNREISLERIEEAARVIDPVFLDSPQFVCEPLSNRLGVVILLKVECVNPIRSFKGRGTDYLLHRLGPQPRGLVCASAGNFGQGMAYAARKRNLALTVFASLTANALKIERMRALGAEVVLEGDDFDAAKEGAVRPRWRPARPTSRTAWTHRSPRVRERSRWSWAVSRSRSTLCSCRSAMARS